MKITQYRYKKDILLSYSRDLRAVVKTLQAESTMKQVSVIRDNFRVSLPGRPDTRVKALPVLVFGATCHKVDGINRMNRYNGCLLLEVNGLVNLEEAEQIRKEAADMPQTLLAFVGVSGRSVKIVVPFSLPDGTLPRKEEKALLFHATAYQLAVKYVSIRCSTYQLGIYILYLCLQKRCSVYCSLRIRKPNLSLCCPSRIILIPFYSYLTDGVVIK